MQYDSKVRQLISEHRFLQFSANWCPDCRYTQSQFDRVGVSDQIYLFDIGDLSQEEQLAWRDAFERETGIRNLPTIIVDGQVWGTESRIHELEESGKLEDALKELGLTAKH